MKKKLVPLSNTSCGVIRQVKVNLKIVVKYTWIIIIYKDIHILYIFIREI